VRQPAASHARFPAPRSFASLRYAQNDLQPSSRSQPPEVILSGAKDLGGGKTEEFPPVEALIPHRGPARLLERIVERSEHGLVALAAVPADSPVVAAGGAPALLALEMAAQAAAALAALERGGEQTGEPRPGYLVGARNAFFTQPVLPNEPLRVTVRPTGSAPPLAVYDFTLQAGATLLASGTISTYLL
jgi:predicted hotdog family 3-hydroxylacyl-ACP dehydratase